MKSEGEVTPVTAVKEEINESSEKQELGIKNEVKEMESTASPMRRQIKDEEEEVDAEDAMFSSIEKEEEKQDTPSKQTTTCPKLLQAALKKEEEPVSTKSDVTKTIEEEKKNDEEASSAAPAKANQLEFLLTKASEYSSFISQDLQELQSGLADQARIKAEKAARKKDKKKKKRKSSSGKSDEKEVIAGGARPIFIQPPNLAKGCLLKDYQLEGVRWLVSLFENGVSGILADEMGLGKTIQVIAMIAHLLTQNVSGPFLVVAPLATLPNWVREIEKWLPDQPVVRYHGPVSIRDEFLRGVMNPKNKKNLDFPIVVTSYEVAIKDQNKLTKMGQWTYLIVDEGQRLKNHRCTLLSSLKRLKSQNRLLLSGTPIQNNLDELWSLLNFVNPSIFDELSVFQSWFGFRDIGQRHRGATNEEEILLEQRKNATVTKLHEILRPFLLRRIKKDVLLDMPPKKEIVVFSGLSALQKGYADMIEQGILRDQLIAQGIEMGRTLSQTNNQMNHRKNVNHPFLFGEPLDPASGSPIGTAHPHLLIKASGKFALLDRMLNRLFNDKHQVLIFSQMTALLNVIEDYLIYRNWKYCRIDGSTNIDDRQRQMDIFNAEKTSGQDGGRNESDDRYFCFLLSTRAGGLGINLTCADTCIIFDSDWNPHQDSQAMDRCHRIGQTRPVAVYRLLSVGSVDIEMMEKALSKKKLERMAIAGGGFKKPGTTHEKMDIKQLAGLLTDDIQGLQDKTTDDLMISDEEFDRIMDREVLFSEKADLPTEGKMYNILDTSGGDLLGAMHGEGN
mmetsp:Transcript_1513/g.2056  ORF Transcript_1513/g.2056 Transcript_1513/m.2056 type:complete len:788 (-) Transcript_1513:75-2438(-)|eukprot:CAMPEP_0178907934 /NCGR_PEP_ID=MMETSP0786-20121207/7643_1 /TAXON_ID=186022 /ORGANISM="Thalassionema frauenfeldii, Strain CCMP 1798" /LENGTH=787 /DNA_ID=CAMNT_0020579781 /DNA_START=241 /DNA_END=2604 /DNA_ORIENTATION=+